MVKIFFEYDEVERETFDGQPYEDYPDTTDYGVQDNIYEAGLDYGDKEQGWEENAGYDSY